MPLKLRNTPLWLVLSLSVIIFKTWCLFCICLASAILFQNQWFCRIIDHFRKVFSQCYTESLLLYMIGNWQGMVYSQMMRSVL